MASIKDLKTNKPIAFDVIGHTMYLKPLTVKEVVDFENKIKELQDNAPSEDASQEELLEHNGSLIVFLFKEILVGEDGSAYTDVDDYNDLYSTLGIQFITALPGAVSEALSGNVN